MTPTDKLDAGALLKADHRKVEDLFAQFEAAKGAGRKKALAGQICMELTVHTRIEEDVFYPACEGKVKPDVVLFGEMLPAEAMARAQRLAEEAELMICVGSSLAVHPVAGLPQLTLISGGRLAIVTKGPTPYDEDAELKLEGEVDEELQGLLAALDAAGQLRPA